MKEMPPNMNHEPSPTTYMTSSASTSGGASTTSSTASSSKPQGILRIPKHSRPNSVGSTSNHSTPSSVVLNNDYENGGSTSTRQQQQHQRLDVTEQTHEMSFGSNSSSDWGGDSAGVNRADDDDSSAGSENSFALEELMTEQQPPPPPAPQEKKHNEDDQLTELPHRTQPKAIRPQRSKSMSQAPSRSSTPQSPSIVTPSQHQEQQQHAPHHPLHRQNTTPATPTTPKKAVLKRSSSFSVSSTSSTGPGTPVGTPKKSALKSNSNHSRDMEKNRPELEGIMKDYYYNENNVLVPRKAQEPPLSESAKAQKKKDKRDRSRSRSRKERRKNRRAGRRPSRGNSGDSSDDASSFARSSFSSNEDDSTLQEDDVRGMTEAEAAALASTRTPSTITARLAAKAAARTQQAMKSSRDRAAQSRQYTLDHNDNDDEDDEEDNQSNLQASFCFNANDSYIGGDDHDIDGQSLVLEPEDDETIQTEDGRKLGRLPPPPPMEETRNKPPAISTRGRTSSRDDLPAVNRNNIQRRRFDDSSEDEDDGDESMQGSHCFQTKDYYGTSNRIHDSETSDDDDEESITLSFKSDNPWGDGDASLTDQQSVRSRGVQAAFAATRKSALASSTPGYGGSESPEEEDSTDDDQSFYSRGPQAAFAATREGVRTNVQDILDAADDAPTSDDSDNHNRSGRASTRDQVNDDMASYCFKKEDGDSIVLDNDEESLNLDDLTGTSEPPSPISVSSSGDSDDRGSITRSTKATMSSPGRKPLHDDSSTSSSSFAVVKRRGSVGTKNQYGIKRAQSAGSEETRPSSNKRDMAVPTEFSSPTTKSSAETARSKNAGAPTIPGRRDSGSSRDFHQDTMTAGKEASAESPTRKVPARSSSAMTTPTQRRPVGILRASSFSKKKSEPLITSPLSKDSPKKAVDNSSKSKSSGLYHSEISVTKQKAVDESTRKSVPSRSYSDNAVASNSASSSARSEPEERQVPTRSSSATVSPTQNLPVSILRTPSFSKPKVQRQQKLSQRQPRALSDISEGDKKLQQLQEEHQKYLEEQDQHETLENEEKQKWESPSRKSKEPSSRPPVTQIHATNTLPVFSDTSDSGHIFLEDETLSDDRGVGNSTPMGLFDEDTAGRARGKNDSKQQLYDDDTLETNDDHMKRVPSVPRQGAEAIGGRKHDRPVEPPVSIVVEKRVYSTFARHNAENAKTKRHELHGADDSSTIRDDSVHALQREAAHVELELGSLKGHRHQNSSQEWKFDLSAMEEVTQQAEQQAEAISRRIEELPAAAQPAPSSPNGDEPSRVVEQSLLDSESVQQSIKQAESKVERIQKTRDDQSYQSGANSKKSMKSSIKAAEREAKEAAKRAKKEAKKAEKAAKKEAKKAKKRRKESSRRSLTSGDKKEQTLQGSNGTLSSSATSLSNSGTFSQSATETPRKGTSGSNSSISLTPSERLILPTLSEEKRRIFENRKRERAERLEKAKERIRQKEEEEKRKLHSAKKARNTNRKKVTGSPKAVFANKPDTGADRTQEQRLELAYQWYTRIGMPNQKTMKQLVREMDGCDITEEDVDAMPWMTGGYMVNAGAIMKMMKKY